MGSRLAVAQPRHDRDQAGEAVGGQIGHRAGLLLKSDNIHYVKYNECGKVFSSPLNDLRHDFNLKVRPSTPQALNVDRKFIPITLSSSPSTREM